MEGAAPAARRRPGARRPAHRPRLPGELQVQLAHHAQRRPAAIFAAPGDQTGRVPPTPGPTGSRRSAPGKPRRCTRSCGSRPGWSARCRTGRRPVTAERRDLARRARAGALDIARGGRRYAALSAAVAGGSAGRWPGACATSGSGRRRCGASCGWRRRRTSCSDPTATAWCACGSAAPGTGARPFGCAASMSGRRLPPAAGGVDRDGRRPRAGSPARRRSHRGPLEPRPLRPTPRGQGVPRHPPHLVARLLAPHLTSRR